VTTATTLPLKPLPTEPRAGLEVALGQRAEIETLAARVVAGGLKNVFLTGSGGGLLTHTPVQFVLERGTARFPTFAYSANELIYRNPAALGPGSLVLICSNTGTTPEVVEAAKFARAAGATIVSYTRLADSPLAQSSDAAFTYGDDKGVGDPKQTAEAVTVLAILRETGDLAPAAYDAYIRTLEVLPDALLHAVAQSENLNHRIAEALKDEPIIYVLGSGPNVGVAYCLAMCYLQEMQWMHAAHFDAAEFLHGAMEVVTDDTPVILYLGEEATRPIDERAKRFLDRYTKKGWYVDARDVALPGIEPAMRPFVSTYVLFALQSRLAEHFEAVRGHDLKNRRYMFKVEY
jgi:fructoselysine-6-P-deglycase FrlB-like protein